MGTRADFYVGRGLNAEWLGSIAWDGYDIAGFKIELAKTEKTYRKRVAAFLASRDDATLPEMGWPWPWEDSTLTDEVYAFDKGEFWNARGYPESRWYKVKNGDTERFRGDADEQPRRYAKWQAKHELAVFPNMKDKTNLTLGKRSGLIVVTAQSQPQP